MAVQPQPSQPSPQPALPQPCTRCGRDADFDFGALWLCVDCYHIAGSTCSGVTRATVC